MNSATDLKQQIIIALDSLPDNALLEVVTFLEFLQFKEVHQPASATLYTPVALGGLWMNTWVTDSDIAEVRHEMWHGFGEDDL